MSYVTLSNSIYARLSPLEGVNVKKVSQSEIQSPTGFPYICVLEDDTTEDEQAFDTISNLAVYRFKVRIVDSSQSLDTTNANMRSLVDLVLAKIREDLTFGCHVASTNIGVKWGYLNEEQTRVCDISLSFKMLIDINL